MKGGKRHIFPGRDTECTRMRSQKHRAMKTSRSHLINLQSLRSHLVCLYFVSLPTDPFQSLMMHREERCNVSRTSASWWKTLPVYAVSSFESNHKEKVLLFPFEGNTPLAIKHLVAFWLFLVLNLCLKVKGTFLGFPCVLKYLLYALEDSHITSLLILASLPFQWLGIIKSRNEATGLFSLESDVICSFSQIHVPVD